MNILVVDDSKASRMIVRRALRQAGQDAHTLTEATNGAEALEMILSTPPDLVLCDWNMPEMTGIELLEAARAKGSTVALGFVTSEGTSDIRQRASDAGAAFFITKPINADKIRLAFDTLKGGA